MDAYTRSYMAAIMPEKGSLESIGSVAANFARSEEEEINAMFVHYSHDSTLAQDILRSHGMVAHKDYIAAMKAASDAENCRQLKKMAKKKARAEAFEHRRE